MKPAAPGDTQPLSPLQPPLRLLRWQARTQVFYEDLGDGARLTMVRIPAGSFQMGSAEQELGRHDNEGPLHTVSLAEFLIGQTPITQAQWRAVASWEPQKGERWGRELNPKPAKFQGDEARLLAGEMNTDERPVERVSWEDAIEFCSRLSQRTKRNYTLPSEAQWEYACRAGTASPYAFGSAITAELANLRLGAGLVDDPLSADGQQTTSVRLHPANAWGLHAMHGNVGEWCRDHWHDSYHGAPNDETPWIDDWIDAKAPLTRDRVVRGGAWSDLPSNARSACRYRLPPQAPESASVGLRVVCLPGGVGDQHDPLAPERQALVVWLDDRHDNNRRERAALENDGVRFQLASSKDEMMGMLASAPVDLLISNMHPHDDPDAVVRMLGQIRAAKIFVPVIFYGGSVNPARIKAVLEAGAVDVIYQPDQLRKAVRSVLAGTIA
jgi:formylglycine-generating enzyme required for sulfatase activity/CheY-like chemotaxis protein